MSSMKKWIGNHLSLSGGSKSMVNLTVVNLVSPISFKRNIYLKMKLLTSTGSSDLNLSPCYQCDDSSREESDVSYIKNPKGPMKRPNLKQHTKTGNRKKPKTTAFKMEQKKKATVVATDVTITSKINQVRGSNLEKLLMNKTLKTTSPSIVSVKENTIIFNGILISNAALLAYFEDRIKKDKSKLKDCMKKKDNSTFRLTGENCLTISGCTTLLTKTKICKLLFCFLQRSKLHKRLQIKSSEDGFVLHQRIVK